MANLTRWDPFSERSFGTLSQTMDDWMNRFMPTRRSLDMAPLSIALDVSENESAYTVKAEIPGVKKEDINVSVDGNVISIAAEVKRDTEERKGDKVIREERYYGALTRSFSLPMDVDQARAEAQYTNGVLTLKLPKKPGTQTRKLQVQ